MLVFRSQTNKIRSLFLFVVRGMLVLLGMQWDPVVSFRVSMQVFRASAQIGALLHKRCTL
jgi:hypothetical protein